MVYILHFSYACCQAIFTPKLRHAAFHLEYVLRFTCHLDLTCLKNILLFQLYYSGEEGSLIYIDQ